MPGESCNTMETADRQQRPELTVHDRAVLTEYLDRHEKRARRWRSTRFVTLFFVCLLYYNGFRSFWPAYTDAMTDFDEKAYIKQLGSERVPSDEVLARHWLSGYTTKVAVIGGVERKLQSLNFLLGMGGAIMLTVALIGTIGIVNRWNDGERVMVMVKFIRSLVEKPAE